MADTYYDAYGQEIELTEEQSACLKYTGNRTLMVKGYAGAGKSIVLMAIADKYRQDGGSSARNAVAVFTFQNTLVSAMKETFAANEAGEETIFTGTVNGYVQDIYIRMVKMGIAPRRKFPYGKKGEEQRVKIVAQALKEHKEKYGKSRLHDLKYQFWLEEFDWMKDMNVWKDDLEYYLSIPRTGRGGTVRMRASERMTAYQLFLIYCGLMERAGYADWADQTLFLVRHRDQIPEDMKFEHVLIDEAQDLSLAQMTAILGLYKKDMTVAMDMNQRIHKTYWTPKLLGIETTTKKLTMSMRTTKQIDNLAESVRRHNDEQLGEDDRSLRAIPQKDGPMPRLVHLKNQEAEKKYVTHLVRAYLEKSDRITIGIIAATKRQMDLYSEWMTDADIHHEQVTKDSTFSMKKPGVKVVTAFGAKGLEFNVVIIPMFAQGYFPYSYIPESQDALNNFMVQMRNLVYVSMTRAKAQLVITYWGWKGSQFIGELDPDLYTLEGEPIKDAYASPITASAATGTDTSVAGYGTSEPGKTSGYIFPHRQEKVLTSEESLCDYLKKNAGLTVSDKRDKGGALWISGSKDVLEPLMKETKKRFGAYWIYSDKRGGYFTKCKK